MDEIEFIARGVIMALHNEPTPELLATMKRVVALDDTLYSHRHAVLEYVDGEPVGLCLAYDGADYHAMRERTFAFFPDSPADLDLSNMEDEAGAGEWYIDSLAVLPEFRRRGIARRLLKAQIKKGQDLGLTPTLLVDPNNPSALRLYESVGFRYDCDVYAFGQIFSKLKLPEFAF